MFTERVLEGIPQSAPNIFRTSLTQMVSLNCTFLVTLNYCLIEMTDIAKAALREFFTF